MEIIKKFTTTHTYLTCESMSQEPRMCESCGEYDIEYYSSMILDKEYENLFKEGAKIAVHYKDGKYHISECDNSIKYPLIAFKTECFNCAL